MKTPQISRRRLLQGLGLAATTPLWIRYVEPAFGLMGTSSSSSSSSSSSESHHVLFVYLRGGNDPFHTVAPIGNDAFTKLRPNVALRESEVFAMGNGYGINRSLPTLFNFWQAGQLAVVRQVGPATPDLSHTAATQRWETGSPDGQFNSGWLGRYLDATNGNGPVRAASFGWTLPLTLTGAVDEGLTLSAISDFGFTDALWPDASARHAAIARFASVSGPAGSVVNALLEAQRQMIGAVDPVAELSTPAIAGRVPTPADNAAQMFAANLGTEIALITLPDFDTHSGQRGMHATSIRALEDVVRNFFATANQLGVADSSAVVVFSEFGRRLYENHSEGTDHGDATDVLLIGPPVNGGMYGPALDVSQAVDGNLPAQIDLRRVYASVLDGWLQTDPGPILGGSFATLPLFRNMQPSSAVVSSTPEATPAAPVIVSG